MALEPQVEQGVRSYQHQVLEGADRHRAALEKIKKASRGRHQHIDAFGAFGDARVDGGAAARALADGGAHGGARVDIGDSGEGEGEEDYDDYDDDNEEIPTDDENDDDDDPVMQLLKERIRECKGRLGR